MLASGDVQELVAAPGDVQELMSASGDVQELVAAPGEVQELVSAPGDVQELVSAPGDVQELVSAPGKVGILAVFLVLLGFRRLYSLSGKYSPSIPFPIETEIPGTQSTRLRPQFHTESLIGKPKILKRQTHGITTKEYRSV